jgi:RNA polymerase sigma-70 factor (ECF subfamily)
MRNPKYEKFTVWNARIEKSDGAILRLFNSGNSKAFEDVYLKLYPQIFFFACSFLEREDAADITGDAFLKLWKGEKHFESLQKIRIFLQVCVRNSCFTYLQKTRFRQEKNRELGQLLDNSTSDEPELPDVKSGLIKKILMEVEKLPPGARKIFKLSVIDGMDSKKIAALLGVCESTVRNQKKRAIDLLRMALKNFS